MEKNKKFAEFLSQEEQEKVLEQAVNKGLFDEVVSMAAEGYTFNIFIFDLIRTSRRYDVLEQIWSMSFCFRGTIKQLVSYVEKCKGSEDAAHFIDEHCNTSKVWNNCHFYFSDSMLEAVQDWDYLTRRGNWKILLKHQRYDDIISYYHKWSSYDHAEIVKILREQKLEQRIIELKKYEWLMLPEWSPEGASRLIEIGKADLLITHWAGFSDIPDSLRTICQTDEGRDLLQRRRKFKWLYDAGYPEYMVQNKEWPALARLNRFDLIDWKQVDASEKSLIINLAVRNNQWSFLLKNRQYKTLLRHGKIKMLLGI